MNRQEKSKRNSAQLQRSLVASLQENRIEHFERVLIDGADILNADEEIKSSVFELACTTPGKSAFIEKCIVHGVQLNKMNPDTGMYPIHLATESHDASNLVVLLNQPTLLMDQETREGKTALCILCDTIIADNWDNIFECIKLLINCHANVNKPSNDGKTPIQLLLDNSFLTDQLKNHSLMYCSMNCFLNVSQETRTTIQDIYNVEISEYTAQHKHFDELRDMLNNVEDEQIVEGFQINNPNTKGFTAEMIRKLLEMCIYRCKPLAAQQMIKSKLDNGKLNNPSKPLGGLLAKCCKLGACEMLRLLLDLVPKDSRGRDFLNQDPLLLYVVESMDSKVHKNSCDLFECMDILLRDPRIEIDKRDGLNRTALQMAGRCKNDYAQKLLLAKGAYIGGSDIDGNHIIGEINPEVLKEHFDSCIIVSDSPLKKIEQFEVDVTNLVEPQLKSGYKEHGYEHTNDTTFHDVLLLLMKFDSMEPNEIILHPLVSCWLHLKWLRCRPVWWVEFGFCTMFLVCFHGFVMLCYYAESSKTEWYTIVLAVLALMVGLPYMFLVINQLCLKRIEGTRYIAGWLKLVMLVLAASFLGNHHFVDEDMQRVIASFTLLCSGFVFIVTIDTVSRLSLSTHIFMLQVVFLNLLKCLIPCVIIVCTFAMSFHMLLHKKDVAQTFETSDVGNTTESVISISEEFHAFKYLGLAFQKTAVMMTGEFDASSMPLTYIPFGIIFLLFILYVSIAFFNLMNGLAVSDVSELRKKSKLLGIGQKIRMLYQYQHTLICFNWILCKIGCPRWRQNKAYDVPDTMHRIIIKLHQKRAVDICLFRKPSEAGAAYHADRNDVELIGQESMYCEQKDETPISMRYRMDKKIVRALKQNFDSSKIYRAHCASCYKF